MAALTIPPIIRGQVLAQFTGYLVRGQYVVGEDRHLGWFWYDIYNRDHNGHGLADANAALVAVAAHITGRT